MEKYGGWQNEGVRALSGDGDISTWERQKIRECKHKHMSSCESSTNREVEASRE